MRLNSRGQITIPAEIRKQAGLQPNADVDVSFDGAAVRVQRSKAPQPRDGRSIVAHIRGRGDVALTTDQILAATRDD